MLGLYLFMYLIYLYGQDNIFFTVFRNKEIKGGGVELIREYVHNICGCLIPNFSPIIDNMINIEVSENFVILPVNQWKI